MPGIRGELIGFEHCLSITPSMTTICKIPIFERQKIKQAPTNFSKRTVTGLLSKNAKKRLKRAISWFVYLSKEKIAINPSTKKPFKFKLAFITLTLPSKQIHDDKIIKSVCLNQFLSEMRQFYDLKNYVWRAEIQQNGNIHFHITIDSFIHYGIINRVWNRCTEKLGYVSRARKRLGKDKSWSPNSTDIHSVRKIHNITAYLCKYFTNEKHNHERIMTGRLWGLSQFLSKFKSIIISISNVHLQIELGDLLLKFSEKIKVFEYFSCLFLPMQKIFSSFVSLNECIKRKFNTIGLK
jgi:hypothetical protein